MLISYVQTCRTRRRLTAIVSRNASTVLLEDARAFCATWQRNDTLDS